MRTMLAAVVVALGVGATVLGSAVEAAPASSAFAGDYSGTVVETSAIAWDSISISSSGRISGGEQTSGTGRFSGSVSSDGTYSLSGSVRYRFGHGGFFEGGVPVDLEVRAKAAQDSKITYTYDFQSGGTLALGTDGNLYGTTTSGATFVWTRK